MPIEIRELHITAVVQDGVVPMQAPAGTSASTLTNNQDSIVAACVEQVLEILKQKNER